MNRFCTLLPSLLLLGCYSPFASAVELSGQYSNLLFQTQDTGGMSRTTDLNRLRLQLEAEVGGDGDSGRLRLHLAYDHELLWGSILTDPVVRAGLNRPDATWLDGSANLRQTRHTNWKHALYRGWLSYDLADVSLKVGRQRIAWGSGRIWNPTDRFNPVQPTALERDQKLGVDAAALQWNYSNSAYLLAVATPASVSNGAARKLALRWQDTWGLFDLSMMIGRIGDELMYGMDVTGNLGDAGMRIEWMQAHNPREGAYGQVSTGLDYTWNNSWFPNGLYTAIEYFYNGAAGLSVSQDRLSGLSNQLLGAQLGYDLTPLWRIEMLFIADLQKSGSFTAPSITWSVIENIDLQCFVQLPQGKTGSEFAHLKNLYAIRADWYF